MKFSAESDNSKDKAGPSGAQDCRDDNQGAMFYLYSTFYTALHYYRR